ncbi:putative FAD-dependent pyridine nucleotide-disulphide oxidoreductase [Desulfosarcina ovata subsp. sediminis]|uniref:Putative FAD-dependent pyridine nucleotide-disulphide oxidoreductase n=1 Tax=Desulfosarcina ovata subsp. sediminis TaxID=885957 RepID=A0A5K7ZSV0_9BACT|nr:NAD(P)/FAD-dependent oxidoreductase [Desulfosarcina ovata]BBO83291.1 putative FAD-dependent pyridine nucleotide-disulphide oxidoreductase [Desulfosarcina ovata subsp. sediminis]
MSKSYDVLIIGSGTAGQTAAYQLNDNGIRVGLVEQSPRPGGTCALSGCQAKKWFYEGAETVARSHHLNGMGITTPAVGSWKQLRDAKNRFTEKVPDRTIAGLKKAGIDFIRGRARFTDRQTLSVGDRTLTADAIVVATGATPMPLPIDGAELAIDSTAFLELDQLPARIVFIGGGFISFEFGHFAARLGPAATRCSILEAAPRPLGAFDGAMVDLLAAASAAEGIEIHTKVAISRIRKSGAGFTVLTGGDRRFDADLVVHGAGRVPDIETLDLDRAGIKASRRGIPVDARMTTSNPNVYAVGDCAATVQLARVADAEAHVAAQAIMARRKGQESETVMDYNTVPAVLFTYPQYAMVGKTEQALIDEGVTYGKSMATELGWPTYRRIGMRSAAYKVLISEDGMILGAHILSDNATGLINTFALAMRNRISVADLHRQSVMTPYPSRESDIIYMLSPLL